MKDYIAIAAQYQAAVLSGTIPACKWVKLACVRNRRDLDRQDTAAFPYRFDPDAGRRICQMAEMLPHIKGPCAFVVGKDDQERPIWNRNGPSRLSKWPGHVAHAFSVHASLLIAAALVGMVLIVLVARWLGRWYAAALAYASVAGALLFGAQTTQTRIESAVLAVAVPILGLLWWLGPRYRPWALFATAVIGVSFLSGTVTSFARQALFAFPVYWAVADGPRPLRHPLFAVVAVAANVAFALTLAKYAP